MDADVAVVLVKSLGPSGFGVAIVLILWLKVLTPMLERMQQAHDKREETSKEIILKAQTVMESALVKNTDILTRVDLRLKDDKDNERRQLRSNDADDDGN